MTQEAILLTGEPCELKSQPTRVDVDDTHYDQQLHTLQLGILQLQKALHRGGQRAVLVFEGIDAAGKGGCIKRLTEHLDPRGVRVHPIGAPTPEERHQHYLQRFWTRLPKDGQIVIFDRSWYGRVLTERVDALAPSPVWQRAYQEISEFERLLVDDGILLCKFFLNISKKEQRKRFIDRLTTPTKRWKITLDDLRARKQWRQYRRAFDDMLSRTASAHAPWHLIPADSKRAARMLVLRATHNALSRQVDERLANLLSAEVLAEAKAQFGRDF